MGRLLVLVLVDLLVVAAVTTLSQGVTLEATYNDVDVTDLFYHGGLPLPTSAEDDGGGLSLLTPDDDDLPLATSSSDDDDDGVSNKIFNGQNYYPFVVYLGVPDVAHVCTGSLLSGKWVLTAAHCTYQGATHVFAGVFDRSQPLAADQQYRIAEIFRHPNYTVYSNDVALVKLFNPVNFTSLAAGKVGLVKSDKYMSQVQDNEKMCQVLGWGAVLTPSRGWRATDTLQVLKLRFVDDEEAVSRGYNFASYEGTMTVEARTYTDECEYSSTCIGDDGAPIVCKKGGRWVQVGVQLPGLSQEGCYTGAKAAVNLNMYTDWIKSITKRK